jgi:hypothetical protein
MTGAGLVGILHLARARDERCPTCRRSNDYSDVTHAAKPSARRRCFSATTAVVPRRERGTGKAVPVVAHLDASERSGLVGGIQQHLKELGWVDGRDLTFETRMAK